DAVHTAGNDRALALELKFDVTDFNGWQTAYGYDDGASRPTFLASVAAFKTDLARARTEFTRPRETQLLADVGQAFDRFMRLDAVAWRALQAGRKAEVRRLFLGPETAKTRATRASPRSTGLRPRSVPRRSTRTPATCPQESRRAATNARTPRTSRA